MASLSGLIRIFPRRACAGQTFTFHGAIAAKAAGFPLLHLTVHDPDRQLVYEHSAVIDMAEPVHRSGAASPLLFLADAVREEFLEDGAWPNAVECLGQGGDWYARHALHRDARLGRYDVKARLWWDGECDSACSWFCLERLFLEDWQPRGEAGARAFVRNPSPQPIEAILCQCDPAGDAASTQPSTLVLREHSLTELVLDWRYALLRYAEGQALLPLCAQGDALYIRSPTCAWMSVVEGRAAALTCRATGKSYTLRGASHELWLRAGGVLSRSLACNVSESALEALLSAQLLRQL